MTTNELELNASQLNPATHEGLHFHRPSLNIDGALLAVRLVLGLIFVVHGSQLMFGAFGGPGLSQVMSPKGISGGGVIGLLVAIGQFFGGLGILSGFLTRFSATALIVIMVGAILEVHAQHGFFATSGGFEYNLALIGLALPLVLAGPGRFSLGWWLPLPKAKQGQPLQRNLVALVLE